VHILRMHVWHEWACGRVAARSLQQRLRRLLWQRRSIAVRWLCLPCSPVLLLLLLQRCPGLRLLQRRR
jgi:hypothetical protein